MIEATHRIVQTNGLQMHIAELGEGPLVLLCHGFPESWYSWRHQLRALAEAGFHAVAPDMRGYGETGGPDEIDRYTLFHLIGDLTGLLDALGERSAAIVGHDWGAAVAWQAALLRPERFRAVVGLSVPFRPRGSRRPTDAMPHTADATFYQLYFQRPGVAEAEFEADARRAIRHILYWGSADAPRQPEAEVGMVPRGGGFLAGPGPGDWSPSWLAQTDLDVYAAAFARTGFGRALNWYRNIDRNWELLAPWAGAPVNVPALYIAGDRDPVVAFRGMDRLLPALRQFVPRLHDIVMLPGCGHWTQQERAREVNETIVGFLRALT